jgi:hypothetical protein
MRIIMGMKKTKRITGNALPKTEAAAGLSSDATLTVNLAFTQEQLSKRIGSQSEEISIMILRQAVALQSNGGTTSERFDLALNNVGEMEPGNVTEAMLAVQMIGVHNAAVHFLRLSLLSNQTVGSVELCIGHASRMMRLFTEQLAAMAKLKGKAGQQKMTVEHVHVHAGGQAIVGPVARESGNPVEAGEAK